MRKLSFLLLLVTAASQYAAASQPPSNQMRCFEDYTNKHLCKVRKVDDQAMQATIVEEWAVTPHSTGGQFATPSATEPIR